MPTALITWRRRLPRGRGRLQGHFCQGPPLPQACEGPERAKPGPAAVSETPATVRDGVSLCPQNKPAPCSRRDPSVAQGTLVLASDRPQPIATEGLGATPTKTPVTTSPATSVSPTPLAVGFLTTGLPLTCLLLQGPSTPKS